MEMPGRKWAASNYRYSHNGQEKESELFAGANSAEYWMYDSRIGRWFVKDPHTSNYPSVNPYDLLFIIFLRLKIVKINGICML